jgi:N utilization substance protein B
MAAGRRSARRQAVFALYRQDLLAVTPEAALLSYSGMDSDSYAGALLRGAARERERVDALLREHLAERLGILERSILRVAVYELLEEVDVPEAVIIDEAVTLAKRYCSAEAGSLVNGVLGSVVASNCTAARVGRGGAKERS